MSYPLDLAYRILMAVFMLLFAYGGVYAHVVRLGSEPELYFSMTAGLVGIAINVFGTSLNLIAVLDVYSVARS